MSLFQQFLNNDYSRLCTYELRYSITSKVGKEIKMGLPWTVCAVEY